MQAPPTTKPALFHLGYGPLIGPSKLSVLATRGSKSEEKTHIEDLPTQFATVERHPYCIKRRLNFEYVRQHMKVWKQMLQIERCDRH